MNIIINEKLNNNLGYDVDVRKIIFFSLNKQK